MHSSSSNSTYFRSHRMKPPKNRPKCEKIKWDGLPSSFKKFRKEIEGHLLQVGAGYLTDDSFLMMYSKLGKEFLKSDVFWKLHQVSTPQAYTDCQYLFGMLMNATAHMENKIIIKYQGSKDGIMAWTEFKKEYGFEGSKDLRIEFLESMAQKPYTNSNPGGLSAYIDHFQAHVGGLENFVPTEYTDAKKKRLLGPLWPPPFFFGGVTGGPSNILQYTDQYILLNIAIYSWLYGRNFKCPLIIKISSGIDTF